MSKYRGLGFVQSVPNKNRRFGAAKDYQHVRVKLENGRKVDLLLTNEELVSAITRAAHNPEDYPRHTQRWFGRLFDLFDL